MGAVDLQYISNESGDVTAVIVPIELWRDLVSERETAYLLASPPMKKRLLEARQRTEGIDLQGALDRLGIE